MQIRCECGSGLIPVVQVEAGDSVDTVVRLIASLIGEGEAQSEATQEFDTCFEIRVQPAQDRTAFRVLIPKRDDIDPRLLALCAMYAAQSRT